MQGSNRNSGPCVTSTFAHVSAGSEATLEHMAGSLSSILLTASSSAAHGIIKPSPVTNIEMWFQSDVHWNLERPCQISQELKMRD